MLSLLLLLFGAVLSLAQSEARFGDRTIGPTLHDIAGCTAPEAWGSARDWMAEAGSNHLEKIANRAAISFRGYHVKMVRWGMTRVKMFYCENFWEIIFLF